MTLVILHETPGWIAVDKPAGITVIPARGEPAEQSLCKRLQQQRGEKLWVVHRLDRDTSGVILFARDADTHRCLSVAFEHGDVRKTYLASTRGVPCPRGGVVDTPLHHARKGKMRPAHAGEPGSLASATELVTLRTWAVPSPIALVQARPRTGRQHQIRVHLRSIGTPLLVDPVYGGVNRITTSELGMVGARRAVCARLTLHAHRIEVPRTQTSEPVEVESPLAPDLQALIDALDAMRGDERSRAATSDAEQ